MSGFKVACRTLAFMSCIALSSGLATAETMKDVFPSYRDWVDASIADRFGNLELLHGTQVMVEGKYDLALGDRYYALRDADAQWVFTELWMNLADPNLKALIFQSSTTPLDNAWAVAVTAYEVGHISDEEADTMDFGAIIEARKASDPEANKQRQAQGLPQLFTVGLTGTPGYDRTTRSLKFSVLLKQDGYDGEFLNANAWVLSRHGYVNLNVLGDPAQAAQIDAKLPELIGLVQLAEGNGYADYAPGVDAVAEGGLSALLGGGAGQVGIVIVLLALLKKFGVLIAVPVIWLVNRLRGKRPVA